MIENLNLTWNGNEVLGCEVNYIVDKVFPKKPDEDNKIQNLVRPTLGVSLYTSHAYKKGSGIRTSKNPPSLKDALISALFAGGTTWVVMRFLLSDHPADLPAGTDVFVPVTVGCVVGWVNYSSRQSAQETRVNKQNSNKKTLQANYKTICELIKKDCNLERIKANGYEGSDALCEHFRVLLTEYGKDSVDWSKLLVNFYGKFDGVQVDTWLEPVKVE